VLVDDGLAEPFRQTLAVGLFAQIFSLGLTPSAKAGAVASMTAAKLVTASWASLFGFCSLGFCAAQTTLDLCVLATAERVAKGLVHDREQVAAAILSS